MGITPEGIVSVARVKGIEDLEDILFKVSELSKYIKNSIEEKKGPKG